MGRGLSLVLERSALMSLPEVYARARFEANDELVELLGVPPAFFAQTRPNSHFHDSPHEAAESNVNLNAQDEVRCEDFILCTLDAFGIRGARLWADPRQRYLNHRFEYVRHLALETRSGYPRLL
jgi:hypothetical protein